MVRLTTFARGTAEGLVVLPIDPTTDPSVLEREGRWPGVWALQLDPREDWSGADALIEAALGHRLVGVLDLAKLPERWPKSGPDYSWVVDATALVHTGGLAEALGSIPWLPEIQDLWLDLEVDQPVPTAAELGMLAGAVGARCCYLYVPRDYPLHATLVRTVAQAAEMWAVRWLP